MKPAILVSYAYLEQFQRHRSTGGFRDWVLDSGAYSALTSGKQIDLHKYIDDAGELLGSDSGLQVVFALDVIGDPEASARNAETMWENGIEAVPTFHFGSDWGYLEALVKSYPKIAFGGLVGRGAGGHGGKTSPNDRLRFLEGCFARAWPKWIHGFGCCDKRLLLRLPFAAVDSTTWLYGPSRYGAVQLDKVSGRLNVLPKRANDPGAFDAGIRLQVKWHLELEQEVRGRFGRQLATQGIEPFDLRLGVSGPELQYFQELE